MCQLGEIVPDKAGQRGIPFGGETTNFSNDFVLEGDSNVHAHILRGFLITRQAPRLPWLPVYPLRIGRLSAIPLNLRRSESAKIGVKVPIGSKGLMHKLALLGLVAAAQLVAADPRIGSWTLISAESSLDPPNKLSIVPLHEGVHVVSSGDTHIDFTAKWDGHGASVEGNPAFDQIELRRISKTQAEVKEKKDGSVVAIVHYKLSADGNELTGTTAQKGHADRITVWTRSGGTKVADNPFAGEWTQDMSKTRLRQGLVLRIEADGNDGVRFSGDFSYTARFDGREYDLRNSINDTVTLVLVDAHTVDSIYRRDDKISQKDRWVVSADGQQMTLTTTGKLESGQQVRESMVFRKQ